MRGFRKPLNSVLIKPAGPDCNLACRYCFYLEKTHLFPQSNVRRMSLPILENVIRQIMTRGGAHVAITWQGGEPTLMGLDFFKRAVEFEQRYGRPRQNVGNGLQTNGLLLNPAWCAFLKQYNFLVGLSLDGPPHIHDRYRRSRGDEPTAERVIDAARRMLDAGVAVNALSVVNDHSANCPEEIYEHHKRLGLTYMQFVPCLEPHAEDSLRPAPFSVTPDQYASFLCRLFDLWHADVHDGVATSSVRWFDSLFAIYAGEKPPECTLLPECGNYVVVEHNGDVYACDFYVEQAWKLGNVIDRQLIDMLNAPLQARFGRRKADLPRACQECPWLRLCRGGCPKERRFRPEAQTTLGNQGNAEEAPHGLGISYFCETYRAFFAHADARFRQLAEAWRARREKNRIEIPGADLIPPTASESTPRRNETCPCGSGKKYKHCCGR